MITERSQTASTVRLRSATDPELWDRLVAAHPGATAFQDWAWLDFQAELLTIRFERLLVCVEDEPVGVLAVARRSAHSTRSGWLPFPFVGPIVPPALLPATIEAFRRWQLRAGLVLARFDVGPSDTEPATGQLLQATGVAVEEQATVALDIAHGSPEKLRAGYSRLRHRNVRRATKDGTTVRLARPGEFSAIIPQVLDEAYGAHGSSSPYPAELGPRFEAWAADHPWATTWVALVGDELAGALVLLGGHPTALLWIGGCLRRFRDSSPNVLLHDAVLEAAIERGHATVDFAGWVDDNVGKFKLSFGAQRRPYWEVESSMLPAGLRSGASRLKSMLGR